MKNTEFKTFLFKTAVMAIACDGDIAEEEISELKKIVSDEIYFMSYDFEEPLKKNIEYIRVNGINAINEYFKEIVTYELNEHQEIILIEVILRMILADEKVEDSELKFLHMVKSKLNIDEEILIVKFSDKINYLIDFNNYGLYDEFTHKILI